jgi:predicted dehydrogenase
MTPTSDSPSSLNRRDFIASTALTGAGLVLAPASMAAEAAPAAPATTAKGRRRYALVGTGSRSAMYRDAVAKTYPDHCEMVGYCDLNEGRLKLAQQRARGLNGGVDVPLFGAAEFDRMIRETKPEVVIVTTKDGAHHEYIVRAMELGCDVMTEKPMTNDEKKCRAILEAQRKTGRKVIVCFNYRYSPHRTQVKDLLMSGVIGDVQSLDFHWLLDTVHGADYFRRWHSHKADSGGLMVHKATHHFDLVNWWLSAIPVTVVANGKRDFYTPTMAKRLGLKSHYERCHTCPETDKCTFFLDLAKSKDFKAMYLDVEKYDGYFRDRCVFRPDIDIEDTMNVIVKYDSGVTLSYSLNAFNGWEGYHIAFNGTKGRLEHGMYEKVYTAEDAPASDEEKSEKSYIRIYPLRAPTYEVKLWPAGTGDHAGGDKVMLDDLFLPQKPVDKYLRAADQRAGAYSALIGVAANHSMLTGNPVRIDELAADIGRPEYPPMPSHEGPVPMPPRV